MLKEVLIVEGKMDTVAVKKAVDAETIETGGFTLAPYTLDLIKAAYEKRGIIIMTDPDGAGDRIRKFLTERFPNAGQAFVPKAEALAHHDVGNGVLNRRSRRPSAKLFPRCIFRK